MIFLRKEDTGYFFFKPRELWGCIADWRQAYAKLAQRFCFYASGKMD
jgi:hypothetical protein